MRRLIFILFLALIYTETMSIEKIDSLENLLKNNLTYSEKLNVYFELIDTYLDTDIQKSFELIKKIEKTIKSSDSKAKLQLQLFTGIAYGKSGEFDKSNSIFNEVINQSKKLNTEEFLARTYLNMGLNYLRVGFIDKATDNINLAEKYAKKYNNINILAFINIGQGLIMRAKDKCDESIKYFFSAEKYFKSKNDLDNLATVYVNLSSCLAKSNLDEGMKYLIESIKINEKLNKLSNLAISYHNLGALYFEKKDYQESIKWLEKSLEIKQKMNNQIGIATTCLAIGEVYFSIKNYGKAQKYLNDALKILEPSQSLSLLMNTYQMLDSLNQKTKNYKKAHEYLNRYYEIQNKLNEVEKSKVVENLNMKYEIANKEKENAQLKRKYDKQYYISTIVIIAAGFIALLSVMLFIKNRNKKKTNKLLTLNKNIIEAKNAELANLNEELSLINDKLKESNLQKDKFFSIVSHDLRSPVSSMYQLIELMVRDYKNMTEEDKIESLECIQYSAKNTFDLIQNLLTWSRSQLNKIEFNPQLVNAFDMVALTISFIKPVADAKGISIINKVDTKEEILIDKEMISTVVRNLVSNSIKFTNPGGKITINIENSDNNNKIFSVKDTGVGIPDKIAETLFVIGSTISTLGTNDEQGTGLGLLLCKEFVEKHNGKIWLESEVGKGTTFYFTVN